MYKNKISDCALVGYSKVVFARGAPSSSPGGREADTSNTLENNESSLVRFEKAKNVVQAEHRRAMQEVSTLIEEFEDDKKHMTVSLEKTTGGWVLPSVSYDESFTRLRSNWGRIARSLQVKINGCKNEEELLDVRSNLIEGVNKFKEELELIKTLHKKREKILKALHSDIKSCRKELSYQTLVERRLIDKEKIDKSKLQMLVEAYLSRISKKHQNLVSSMTLENTKDLAGKITGNSFRSGLIHDDLIRVQELTMKAINKWQEGEDVYSKKDGEWARAYLSRGIRRFSSSAQGTLPPLPDWGESDDKFTAELRRLDKIEEIDPKQLQVSVDNQGVIKIEGRNIPDSLPGGIRLGKISVLDASFRAGSSEVGSQNFAADLVAKFNESIKKGLSDAFPSLPAVINAISTTENINKIRQALLENPEKKPTLSFSGVASMEPGSNWFSNNMALARQRAERARDNFLTTNPDARNMFNIKIEAYVQGPGGAEIRNASRLAEAERKLVSEWNEKFENNKVNDAQEIYEKLKDTTLTSKQKEFLDNNFAAARTARMTVKPPESEDFSIAVRYENETPSTATA